MIVAAGSGTRFGPGIPKQLSRLGGKPLIEHSVAAFAASGVITSTVVVSRIDLVEHVAEMLGETVIVVAGGETRAASVRAGLDALDAPDGDTVLVHDAARPLVSPSLITAMVDALAHTEAVTAAVTTSDTLLRVENGIVADVPDRSRYYRAQTPQGFRVGVIRSAHAAAAAEPGFAATDDCGIVNRFAPDVAIAIIPGSERNIKVTTPDDIALADRLLSGG